MNTIGETMGKAGITPNALTAAGFALALLAGFLFAYRPSQTYLAALSIVGSGVLDVLDGAVARATDKVSTTGSFNDSTLDRISEIAIFAGIIYAGYHFLPSVVVLAALGFSLLVSYVRAKGESLGIKLSGIGIGERAERLIVLIVFSLAGLVWIAVYIILILVVITFAQRYVYVTQAIREKKRVEET